MASGHRSTSDQSPSLRDFHDMVVLGRVSGVYGVGGWVKVYSHTSPRTNILQYSPWCLGRAENWETRELVAGHTQGKGIVVQLQGCADRDQAAELVGLEIGVNRKQLPPTEPDEYYWTDLYGLTVKTTEGEVLGKVDYLFTTGANDVVVIRGDRERLIPFVWEDVIRRIDLDSGLMVVDWNPEF